MFLPMKNKYAYISILFILFAISCAGGGSSIENRSDSRAGTEILVDNPEISLDQYLNRLSGVRVTGSGRSAIVIVRGSNSSTFHLDPRPLFVLDGVRIGRDFSQVYSLVTMNNVTSLKLLNTSKATLLFGHEGNNGVIEIKTEV